MTQTQESQSELRAKNLKRLIAPASIAVVGASNRAGHFANQPLVNLRRHGFAGDVFPVNPNNDEVGGYRCYPRLTDLPTVPDLVVVVVRPDLAVEAVRDAAELGAGGAVVVGSGFAETSSADGVELQEALHSIVARTGMDKVTVSRAAQGLAQRRLVGRSDHHADGRSHVLALSAEGQRLYGEVAPLALD